MNTTIQQENYGRWAKQFELFEKYGSPFQQEYQLAVGKLGFWERSSYSFNYLAFLLGPIYFFTLGLYKKGLVLLLAIIPFALILGGIETLLATDFPDYVWIIAGLIYWSLYMMTVNYAYYLLKVKNRQSWNPFEGVSDKAKA